MSALGASPADSPWKKHDARLHLWLTFPKPHGMHPLQRQEDILHT